MNSTTKDIVYCLSVGNWPTCFHPLMSSCFHVIQPFYLPNRQRLLSGLGTSIGEAIHDLPATYPLDVFRSADVRGVVVLRATRLLVIHLRARIYRPEVRAGRVQRFLALLGAAAGI
jgi:hypothetical protein